MSKNLIAYIPSPNPQHLEWFSRHPGSCLVLISQEVAECLVQRLNRNLTGLSTEIVEETLFLFACRRGIHCVTTFKTGMNESFFGTDPQIEIILADEDVSHAFATTYLSSRRIPYKFENIRARWDMHAVKEQQPVIPDCEISMADSDLFRIREVEILSQQSPDWWRQIGAMVFRGPELLACGWNQHFPTEYETSVFGDPRLNFDARDPEGMDAYVSLHAEEHVIAHCAKRGMSLEGTSMYINTFPCGRCARVVAMSGIKELFFREGSSFLKGFEILKGAGVRIVQVREDPESAC
jgi:dCMP deaminase